MSHLILISGTSGAGKSTIINNLLKKHKKISLSISHTTRQIRKNETNKKDYNFINKNEFLKMVENKEFYEYTKYDNEFYGTSFSQLKKNEIVILDVEKEGSLKFNEFKILKIFLFNKKEVLRERLFKRFNDFEKVEKRLETYESDLENLDNFDCVIETDDLNENLKKIEKLIFEFVSNH